MLSDDVREQARTAIQSRFKLRNDVLAKELEQLAGQSAEVMNADDQSRLGIRLRLVCEHDLYERAFIIWNNLKKAHGECGGTRSNTLVRDFMSEARKYMEEAALNLANHLKQHASSLAPAFQGSAAINADWISALRTRALEKYNKDMEDYVQGLSWGLRSVISNIRT